MTLIELCKEVLAWAKISGTITDTETATGDHALSVSWVNSAINDIISKPVSWKFMRVRGFEFNTSIGKRDYSAEFLNIDVDKFDIYSFRRDNIKIGYIKYEDIQHLDDRVDNPTAVSFPESDTIWFDSTPVSEQTITCDYFKNHPRLTKSTDKSFIPEKYDQLIIAYALKHYASFDDASEVWASKSEEAERLYKELYRQQAIVRVGSVL